MIATSLTIWERYLRIRSKCYITEEGRPYGINHYSPSNPPTHFIEYTIDPDNDSWSRALVAAHKKIEDLEEKVEALSGRITPKRTFDTCNNCLGSRQVLVQRKEYEEFLEWKQNDKTK